LYIDVFASAYIGLHPILNNIVWFESGEFDRKSGDLGRFFAGDKTAGL